MRIQSSVLLFLLFSGAAAFGQVRPPVAMSQGDSRFDVGVGFERVQANAPPGICECFGDTGGFADFGWSLSRRLSLAAEFTGENDNHISSLGRTSR
jgi:hypothetical protein